MNQVPSKRPDVTDSALLETLARVVEGSAEESELDVFRVRYGAEAVNAMLLDLLEHRDAAPLNLSEDALQRHAREAVQTGGIPIIEPALKRRPPSRKLVVAPRKRGGVSVISMLIGLGAAACLALVVGLGLTNRKPAAVVTDTPQPAQNPEQPSTPPPPSMAVSPAKNPKPEGTVEPWTVVWIRGTGLSVDGQALAAGNAVSAQSVLQNAGAEPASVLFGDTVQITLDAGAVLSGFVFDEAKHERSARIEKGRAFLEYYRSPLETVAAPFVVACGGMEVTVTGTRFALTHDPTAPLLHVASGSVKAAPTGSAAGLAVHAREKLALNEPKPTVFDPAQDLNWLPDVRRSGTWNLIEDGTFDAGKSAWFDNDLGRANEWSTRDMVPAGGSGVALYRQKLPGEQPRVQQIVRGLERGATYRLSYRIYIEDQRNLDWGGVSVRAVTWGWGELHPTVYHRLRGPLTGPVANVPAGEWVERFVEFKATEDVVRILAALDGPLLLTAAIDDIRLVKIAP